MKKIFTIFVLCALVLSLVACSSNSSDEATPSDQTASVENATSEESSFDVDKGLANVTVTIPASFFGEDTDYESVKTSAEEKGYKSCTVNDDGSVTFTMPKSVYNDALKEMHESSAASFDALVGSEEYPSFVKIEYNDDFSEIKVYVDPAKYSMADSFSALTFYMTGAYYQVFKGVDSDNIDVVVEYIDNETGDIKDTASYKNWINNLSDTTTE